MLCITQNNQSKLCSLFEDFLPFEIDSPLVSQDRIDESKISLRHYGHIHVITDSCAFELLVEKINDWNLNNQNNCAYFFRPVWKREGDPHKTPYYKIFLTGWSLHKGGKKISSAQKEIFSNFLSALKAKDLLLNSDV